MTQKQLHSLSGLSPSYIGGIERGERKPAVVAIAQLAAALDVAPSELVRRAEVEMERRKAGAEAESNRPGPRRALRVEVRYEGPR